jgi:hypothetical protein
MLACGAALLYDGVSTSGVDLTLATPWPRIRDANVKSKTPLEIYIY